MSEFSDQPGFDSGTDFTDSVQDSPPQTPEAPPSVSPTPEPEPDNVDKADSSTEQPPVENNPENSEHDVNDLYDLVLSLKESEEEFQAASLENQVYLAEQSKNLLSATILLLFLLGVLSGILFARVVWRKI